MAKRIGRDAQAAADDNAESIAYLERKLDRLTKALTGIEWKPAMELDTARVLRHGDGNKRGGARWH